MHEGRQRQLEQPGRHPLAVLLDCMPSMCRFAGIAPRHLPCPNSARTQHLHDVWSPCFCRRCLHCSDASGALLPAPASRFSFRGPLAPVVMVSGSGSSVPWCCPIDSFSGEEDVPQVSDVAA